MKHNKVAPVAAFTRATAYHVTNDNVGYTVDNDVHEQSDTVVNWVPSILENKVTTNVGDIDNVPFRVKEVSFVTDQQADKANYEDKNSSQVLNNTQQVNNTSVETYNYETNPIIRKESTIRPTKTAYNRQVHLKDRLEVNVLGNAHIEAEVEPGPVFKHNWGAKIWVNSKVNIDITKNDLLPYMKILDIEKIDDEIRVDSLIRVAIITPNTGYSNYPFLIEDGMIMTTSIGMFRIVKDTKNLFTDINNHFVPGTDTGRLIGSPGVIHLNLQMYVPNVTWDWDRVDHKGFLNLWKKSEDVGDVEYLRLMWSELMSKVRYEKSVLAGNEIVPGIFSYKDDPKPFWNSLPETVKYNCNDLGYPFIISIGRGYFDRADISSNTFNYIGGYVYKERTGNADISYIASSNVIKPGIGVEYADTKEYEKAVDRIDGICTVATNLEQIPVANSEAILVYGGRLVNIYRAGVADVIFIPVRQNDKLKKYPIFIKYTPLAGTAKGGRYKTKVEFIMRHPRYLKAKSRYDVDSNTSLKLVTDWTMLDKELDDRKFYEVVVSKEYEVKLDHYNEDCIVWIRSHTDMWHTAMNVFRKVYKHQEWYILAMPYSNNNVSKEDFTSISSRDIRQEFYTAENAVHGIVYYDGMGVMDNISGNGILVKPEVHVEAYGSVQLNENRDYSAHGNSHYHVPVIQKVFGRLSKHTEALNGKFIKSWTDTEVDVDYSCNNSIYVHSDQGRYANGKITLYSGRGKEVVKYRGFALRNLPALDRYKRSLGYKQMFLKVEEDTLKNNDIWLAYRADKDTIKVSMFTKSIVGKNKVTGGEYDSFPNVLTSITIGKRQYNEESSWKVLYMDGSTSAVIDDSLVLPTWLNKEYDKQWFKDSNILTAQSIGEYDSDVKDKKTGRPVLPIMYIAVALPTTGNNKYIDYEFSDEGMLAYLSGYIATAEIEKYYPTKAMSGHMGYISIDHYDTREVPVKSIEVDITAEF